MTGLTITRVGVSCKLKGEDTPFVWMHVSGPAVAGTAKQASVIDYRFSSDPTEKAGTIDGRDRAMVMYSTVQKQPKGISIWEM